MTSLFVSAADFSPLDFVLGMIGPRNGREKIFPISRDALAILIVFDEADRRKIYLRLEMKVFAGEFKGKVLGI